ncbi:hypothetical protein EMIHUDRAFT_224967 [Emiliania huxleyi CCMP1516]|uniref:DM domain-containing protein n=2 Tax=Emiliania huxleyi TaxID=2903 RepID=A0A0D3KQC4_EMIH1|nr:hypothetical protein EMIHUDRAFT_224967 [Emiliania huxleyi CCMP1516]EOD37959.1 hypothetical protein EMIHUDRAFT_224967 [Emiliania huxleyi CCMP1516]|eukprot:XP_005790388.1 hypothetical protein EMIHUDRAFT_224967 [Emiliania huxleyi CCMP1516]
MPPARGGEALVPSTSAPAVPATPEVAVGIRRLPRLKAPTGQCATCGAQLLLKYAHRTMCCRYACLKAAAAKRRARHADGSADDAIVAVLGMHFCDPNQLIATKQRNKLAAANKALC